MIFRRSRPTASQKQNRPIVSVEKCLRNNNHSCNRCAAICPMGCIGLTNGPQISADCLGCGLCESVCPADAFRHPAAEKLLKEVLAHASLKTLALGCSGAPAGPERPDTTTCFQVQGCLSALGPEVLLALFAHPVESLILPTAACTDCPHGDHGTLLDETADLLNRLFPDERHKIYHRPAASSASTPLKGSDSVDLSRRALFGRLTEVANDSPRTSTLTVHGPNARRNLLHHSLCILKPSTAVPLSANRMINTARISLTGSCSCCSACAKICPSGALSVNRTDSRFNLNWTPWKCQGCQRCVQVCRLSCLQAEPTTTAQLTEKTIVLNTCLIKKCSRCGAINADQNNNLCGLCATRFTR